MIKIGKKLLFLALAGTLFAAGFQPTVCLAASTDTSVTMVNETNSNNLILTPVDGGYSITKYNGTANTLDIEALCSGKTIVSIGANAFEGNTAVVDITIPASVTKIESGAFSGCTSLGIVTFNNPDTDIAEDAFPAAGDAPNMVFCSTANGKVTDYTASFDIRVWRVASKLELVSKPTTTTYKYSDVIKSTFKLKTTGLDLKVTYLDGTSGYASNGMFEIQDCNISQVSTDINDAGTQTISVTYGNQTVTFDVFVYLTIASTISNPLSGTNYYTGNPVEAKFTLIGQESKETLTEGVDYKIEYQNNIEKGTNTATATFIGMGLYKGCPSRSKVFSIIDAPTELKSLEDSKITIDESSIIYNGLEQKPVPTVTLNGVTVSSDNYDITYSNNINYGTKSATLTITGKGNYTGTNSTAFTISQRPLSTVTFDDISNQMYTGSAIVPSVRGYFTRPEDSQTIILAQDTDYTVAYSNNTDAGTATVTITGINNYKGVITKNFTITAVSLTNSMVGSISSQTYTGLAVTPEPVVTVNGTTLMKGTHYTVSYENNIDVGTAKAIITGIGKYTGTVTKEFTITAADLAVVKASIANITNQTYTGLAITPEPAVTINGTPLIKGTHYTVSYMNNLKAGTATITITGTGNYKGTLSKTFEIAKRSLENAIVQNIPNQTATGSYITPAISVTLDGDYLVNGTDYDVTYSNNINAGTATATITGKGNYTGTVSKNFTIVEQGSGGEDTSIQLTSSMIANITEQTYTGLAITPEPVITVNGTTLTKDTHYTVAYINNRNAGTATVTITGMNGYKGTVSKTFTIAAASIKSASISNIPEQTATGLPLTPVATVTLNNRELISDTDYTVSYSNNINPGTAVITITGIDNYKDTITKTFTITAITLTDSMASGISSQTYTGFAITPAVTVTCAGVTLVKNTDYTVNYANNINVGTAKAIITGTGKYTGTITKEFTITAADLTAIKAGIANIPDQTYTGLAVTPEPVVTVNGTTLMKGTHYTVSYENNINAGTAKVIITGKGNYTGTLSRNFTILAKGAGGENTSIQLTGSMIANIGNQTYTGSAITPEPVVTVNGAVLTKGTHYTVAYKNNQNVGTAAVTVTGKNGYTGTVSKTFTIVAASIKSASISSIPEQTATGKALQPAVTVKLNEKTLVKDKDYTVAYSNNINAGTATVTVTGIGNYTGTATTTFLIKNNTSSDKIKLKKAKIKTAQNKKGKKLYIKWAKVSGATKYEITIATNKKFKSGKKVKTTKSTSYTFKKLKKKKTYYIRVRAFTYVNGTKVYGPYSTVKKVKIRK